MTVSTKDNLAQIILCSNLGYDPNDEKSKIKPFTTAAFNKLEKKLLSANLQQGIFLTEKVTEIAKIISLTEYEQKQAKLLFQRVDRLGEEIERLATHKIYITTRTQENYPQKLLKAMGSKAPVVFYFCGEMRLLEKETVAIIGSREATEQESEYAKKHAQISAQNGVTVVSGGARGIDSIAKESALKSGGDAITYVSDNMVKYITKNADHILWDKMLVLSAFHPEMSFRGYNALERNKFIYASSDYAVVVSSGNGTGGSFKGAAECLKSQLTKLYVKCDSWTTMGNQKLIEMGGLPLNEGHERLE